jgi:hypothetical protein
MIPLHRAHVSSPEPPAPADRGRRPGAGGLLSVVVPCFNERDVIEQTHRRLVAVLPTTGMSFEIVYVDDGSRDDTAERLRKIAAEDERIRLLEFSRNFGQQAAMSAGMAHARGDAVAIIDADLQDPPEVIPEMVRRWRQGVDVAYGRRRSRGGETAFKLLTASLFHRLFAAVVPYPIPIDTGDFKLCDRAVIDAVCSLPERRRYLRSLVPWVGFRHEPVWYDREARVAGETKYSPRKLLALAADALILSSDAPVRLAWLGAGSLSAAGAIAAGIACWAPAATNGPSLAALIAAGSLIAAVPTAAIAVVGEYVVRTYREVQGRPPYVLRSDTETSMGTRQEVREAA